MLAAAATRWKALLWVGMAVLTLAACKTRPVTLTIGRDELQRRVEARFPLEHQVLVTSMILERPRVLLPEGGDRVGLELLVRVRTPLLPEYRGTVGVVGALEYRPEEKAFYLRQPTLERLDIDGLRTEHTVLVRGPVETAVGTVLETLPIYRLDGGDLKDLGARHLLRSVTVRDGEVHATFALP